MNTISSKLHPHQLLAKTSKYLNFKLSNVNKYTFSELKVNSIMRKWLHTNIPLLHRCEQLIVKEYGDPVKVVTKETVEISLTLKDNEVLVRMLASPVHPADINTIQGVYAVKPDCPFIPGNEAVMEVVSTGSPSQKLKKSDLVTPRTNAIGTWRSMAILNEDSLIKIPSNISVPIAATIGVNPCTAYRMLKDFVSLKEGDCVIQNCANSAVGRAVIQLASLKNIQTINVVRDRPNFEDLRDELISLGASLVVTEEDLRKIRQFPNLPKPILGLNGVSGKPGTDLLRKLDDGSTMVTYGGMSRQPVTVPVGSLIFNNITLRGYWMTEWNKNNKDSQERKIMLNELFDLASRGKLDPPPHDFVKFEHFQTALKNAMPTEGKLGKKQILVFD